MSKYFARTRAHILAAQEKAPKSEDIGSVLHEMILPLLNRLKAIQQIDDADTQRHMLEKLLKDYPKIAKAVIADNSLARKLSPLLERHLSTGLQRK